MNQLLDSVQVLGAPELTGAGSSWGIAPAPKISPAKVTGENRQELAVSAERGCAPNLAGRQLTDSNNFPVPVLAECSEYMAGSSRLESWNEARESIKAEMRRNSQPANENQEALAAGNQFTSGGFGSCSPTLNGESKEKSTGPTVLEATSVSPSETRSQAIGTLARRESRMAGLATGPLVIQSRKVKLHSPNTKPIGRDTENVTINLPIAEAKLLAKIAFDAVRSRGDLIKELLLIGAAQKFGAVVSEQIQKIRANHRELVTNGGLAGAAFALLCFGLVVFQECAHLGKLRQIRTSAKAGFARIAKQKRDENFITDLDFAQEV